MLDAHRPSGNLLLDGIACDARERLGGILAHVEMPAGQILHLAQAPVRDVYFPITSIVSKVYLMGDGTSSAVALVGAEGMVGISAFLGGIALPDQAQVLRTGEGWKISAQRLAEEFDRGGSLMAVLLGYTCSLIAQMMQTSACNNHGTLQERLCRWLLMNLDRGGDEEMKMTHQVIADVLGVRRESISEAAAVLQNEGVIRYRWGRLRVLDRPALERKVCECYRPVRPPQARAATSRSRDPARPFGSLATTGAVAS